MKKTLSKREKVLIAVLIFLAVGAGYGRLFLYPMQERLRQAEARIAAAQDALALDQVKLAQMQKMEQELKALEKEPSFQRAPVPKYDNIQQVMVQLDAILKAASDYELTFADPEQTESLFARAVSLKFSAGDYDSAREILGALYRFPDRCVLQDITVLPLTQTADAVDILTQAVSVSLTITFYEQGDAVTPAPSQPDAPQNTAD